MKSSLPLLLLVALVSSYAVAASVTLNTTSLPNGTVKTAYSAVINASGGCTPYQWAIVSGNLPAGIARKTSSNTTVLDLSGIPTTAASYSFTVQVTGCGGHLSKASYKIVIQSTANHVVDLDWKASTSKNVAGYNVYRTTAGSTWKKLNVSLIASTLYSDSTVANNTTYFYSATTVDIYGHESSKSAALQVAVP